jgi:predicted DNA-binding transcriptional regulator AlpA
MRVNTHPEVFSIEELAESFGVTPKTVRGWNASGRGPKRIKIGRRVFYRQSDVAEWLSAKDCR